MQDCHWWGEVMCWDREIWVMGERQHSLSQPGCQEAAKQKENGQHGLREMFGLFSIFVVSSLPRKVSSDRTVGVIKSSDNDLTFQPMVATGQKDDDKGLRNYRPAGHSIQSIPSPSITHQYVDSTNQQTQFLLESQ